MGISIEEKKLSDMTGKELKELIKDTVLELIDPDHELELRPEVEDELKEFRFTIVQGKQGPSFFNTPSESGFGRKSEVSSTISMTK